MAARNLDYAQHIAPNVLVLSGQFTIGAAGAVSAQTGAKLAGATVVKNAAAGRYDLTFYKTFKAVRRANVNMVGPASSAFPTTTGSNPQLRSLAASGFTVQFKRPDTEADADAASGTICCWTAEVTL